jgi:hypothetical protein
VSEVLPPEHFSPDELMEALVAAGVRFILIGGLAVGVHGAVRATRDMDIVPDPNSQNLERLAAVYGQLDVLQESEVIPSFATLAADAIEIDWRGHRIRVCSLARLREMKLAADRPVDRLDLEALDAAHGQD